MLSAKVRRLKHHFYPRDILDALGTLELASETHIDVFDKLCYSIANTEYMVKFGSIILGQFGK